MKRALATFRLPDGSTRGVGPGDLIGRMWTATVQIDDPRVSEGHALASLRGGDLWLLALRRRLAIDGRSVAEVRLEVGQRIGLAQGLELEVVAVEVPDDTLAVRAPGLPATALPGVCSVRVSPVSLVPRYEPDAPCQIWDTGDGWRRSVGGVVAELRAGDRWSVAGVELEAVRMALRSSGQSPTRMTGGIDPPLRLRTQWDTAHVQVGTAPPVTFSGVLARILSELVAVGGPASWEVVAREIWADEEDAWVLRKRWDVALGRLRSRLREGGVRADLVRAVGTGQVELVLRPDDIVEDRA